MLKHITGILLISSILIFTTTTAECQAVAKNSVIMGIEKFKEIILKSEKSVGLNVGTVFTEAYDAGFGTEIQFNQTFLHPYIDRPFLRSSPSIQFWGASNKYEDISVLGFIETITHRAPIHPKLSLFAGMSAGYFYIYKKAANPLTGSVNDLNTNSFEMFITLGTELKLNNNNSMFFQFKYGETSLSRQIHTSMGITFSTFKKSIKNKL